MIQWLGLLIESKHGGKPSYMYIARMCAHACQTRTTATRYAR